MLRMLGTDEVIGWNNGVIDLAQNSPAMLESNGGYRGAGRCWAAFDKGGSVVAIIYEDYCDDARERALSVPGQVAVAPFMASCTQLVLEFEQSVMTGSVRPHDPTLGFTGEYTYGNGETVRYIRGEKVQ